MRGFGSAPPLAKSDPSNHSRSAIAVRRGESGDTIALIITVALQGGRNTAKSRFHSAGFSGFNIALQNKLHCNKTTLQRTDGKVREGLRLLGC